MSTSCTRAGSPLRRSVTWIGAGLLLASPAIAGAQKPVITAPPPPEAVAAPPPAVITAPPPQSGQREPQRTVSLSDAIDLALRTDPQIFSAQAVRDRNDLAVLRAQLDRFSLRVDSFVTEQYRASNFGGSAPTPTCAVLAPTQALTGSGTLLTPLQLYSIGSGTPNAPTQAECEAAMGQYIAPGAVQTGFLGQFNLSADLRVPVFTGFRVTANVERAKHLRDAARASVRQTERGVALDAVRAYWAVRRIELQQLVSLQAIERFKEAESVVRARVRAGLAPAVDENRIETRKQSELARSADLLGSAAEARAQLAVALGLGGTEIQLTEAVDLPPQPPSRAEDVDRLLGEAMRERPEVRVARQQSLAGGEAVRMALSAYYPQLSLSSLLQFSNNPLNPLVGARTTNSTANPFSNITGSVFVGGTLSINLFDTLNTYTGVRDARYELKRLESEERRIGRLIETDVRVLHARLWHLYTTREPLLKSREISRDNLTILEKRYRNGDVFILDLIDAQVELLNAEINLANQAATIAQTWSELYLATGRLPPAGGIAHASY